MIAGKEDNIWNSWDGCMTTMDALSKHYYKHKYCLLSYENAGHPFPLPYIIPVKSTQSMKMAPRFVFTTGGTVEGNALKQKDSWDKTLEFFKS